MATKMEGFMATLKDVAAVGSIAAVWQNVWDYIMEQTSMPGWARALIAGLTGIGVGLAVGTAFPNSPAAHVIAVGIGTGGVVSGIRTAVRETRAAMYIKRMTSDSAQSGQQQQQQQAGQQGQQQQQQQQQAAAGGRAASGLPRGGIPAGFQVKDRASCAA